MTSLCATIAASVSIGIFLLQWLTYSIFAYGLEMDLDDGSYYQCLVFKWNQMKSFIAQECSTDKQLIGLQ